jgi:phage baseplate assembly protein V
VRPLEDVNRRLGALFSRGVIRHADVAAGMAAAQAEFLVGETRRVELPQGFGFASNPMPGSEVFAAFADGERDQGIALAFDDRRVRPLDLKPGESVFYGVQARDKPNGHWIKATNDPKPGTIKWRSPRIELRAGQFYVLLDADPAIGAQKGIFDPGAELPLNPGGAAL